MPFWSRRAWVPIAVAAVSLLAAGCGDDDGADPPAATATETGAEGVALRIGLLVPETGALAAFASSAIEAMQLAVADSNAAGGNITVTVADTATDPATAREGAARLLEEGADVIVGPFTSESTQAVIQTLFEARTPQCSPSAQSPDLSAQENAAYFFRTIQPARAVAPLMARIVVEDGGSRIAIIDRAAGYGGALMAELFQELGAETEVFFYDPGAATFEGQVAAIVAYGPDAILNFGFSSAGASIMRGLLEAGFEPEMQYAGDALLHPLLWQTIDPNDRSVIDGMKFIGIAGREEFTTRISAMTEGNVNFAAQGYDCVVLLALAAEAAGGTDGDALMEAIGGLTHEGVECFSYRECASLIRAGEAIDYVGASGPLDLTPEGDPAIGLYGVFQFENGQLTTTATYEVDLRESQ